MSEDVEEDSQLKFQVEVCKRKNKLQFKYENELPWSPEYSFFISVFYTILDTSLASLNNCFEQLDFYNTNFKF